MDGEKSINEYPKSYRENMEWRRKLLAKCTREPEYREKVKELFFRDPIFAFNAFFYTYDPRKRPFHIQPFCTYDYQDEAILDLVDVIKNGEDFLVEKSRDMGISWLVITTFLWLWLNPSGGSDFLCGSRIEDYVDKKGDMRTLLQKVRFAFYRLPRWLWPRGFKKNLHDNFMRFQNPQTEASITGESNNANYSTGGRYAAILFDEFAKWESTDKSAWTAAGDASPCRIPVSTPFGAGGQYYDSAHEGKIRKIRLHWSLHPEKSKGLYCVWPLGEEEEIEFRSPWYDRECERRSPREIKQELDIDYLGAGNPVFDGKAAKGLSFYRRMKQEPKRVLEWREGEFVGGRGRDGHGCLTIFEEFSLSKSYVISSDVAEGKEDGDWSVVKVFCRETQSVDATWFGHVDERELAFVIRDIQKMFLKGNRIPWAAIETFGPGLSTFDKCLDLEVPNLFMMPRYETSRSEVTYRKGWITNQASRKMLVGGIKEHLAWRNGFIDPRCVGELGTFVYGKTGKAAAKSGCHDDEVLALGIAIQVAQLVPLEEAPASQELKNVRGGEREKFFKDFTPEEEPSIEERCLANALEKQELSGDKEFWDDFTELGYF